MALIWLLLWYALTGLIIGALARLLHPGREHMGILMTILIGIAGSLLAGLIAHWIGLGTILTFVAAVIIALILIILYGRMRGR